MCIETVVDCHCNQCHREVSLTNDQGVCRDCFEDSLISMSCTECGYRWKSPGLSYECVNCKSTRITTGNKASDEWLWTKVAEDAGVRFLGLQRAGDDSIAYPLFNDDQTGSFVPGANESVREARDRKRREFQEYAERAAHETK